MKLLFLIQMVSGFGEGDGGGGGVGDGARAPPNDAPRVSSDDPSLAVRDIDSGLDRVDDFAQSTKNSALAAHFFCLVVGSSNIYTLLE